MAGDLVDVSYSQREEVACPQCGARFACEAWLIVDATARPDLVTAAAAGTLHDITCPNGHERKLEAPVLFYLRDREPPLLLSPAESTSEAEDREQATTLAEILRDTLGKDWDDAWLSGGLPFTPRARLAEQLGVAPTTRSASPQASVPSTPSTVSEGGRDGIPGS